MRWLSIVHTTVPRITATDVDVAGVTIPAGQLVFASLPSGNRDPNFIAEPDTLDIRRGAPGHLAFGHGVHHCLGAPLARMEARVGLTMLLQAFPALRLDPEVKAVWTYGVHESVLHGPDKLPALLQ